MRKTIDSTGSTHKQSIITEFLNQSENREDKVRENELRKRINAQKNKAKKLLALYDGSDDLILDAYKDAKRTLDMMEAELASWFNVILIISIQKYWKYS